jgi:hypothetical protein
MAIPKPCQYASMVRAWMTQEMETEALSAVAYTMYIQISAQTSLAAAVVDLWQTPTKGGGCHLWHGQIEVAALGTRTKKQKGTLLDCFSGGEKVVLQTVWKPCKPASMLPPFSLTHVLRMVCTSKIHRPYLISPPQPYHHFNDYYQFYCCTV